MADNASAASSDPIQADERVAVGFSLRQALMGLLLAAFLPAGGLTLGQIYSSYAELTRLKESQLMQEAQLAARPPHDLFLAARSALKLASAQDVGRDGPSAACNDDMRRIADSDERFFAAHFTTLEGMIVCGSAPDFEEVDVSEKSTFKEIIEAGASITLVTRGQSTKRHVVVVVEPVMADDELRGYVSVSILTRQIDAIVKSGDRALTERYALFTPEATFASDLGEPDSWLPKAELIDALISGAPQLVYATSRDDRRFVYAVTEVTDEGVYALSGWPETQISDLPNTRTLLTILLPLLAWGVAIAVVYLAADRLVLRHMGRLEALTDRLRLGDLSARSQIPATAPEEFASLGKMFDAMAEKIEERESRLLKSIREERLLLREVYHRVKNNLQLIVSLINLQARSAASPEEKGILQKTQDRVQSLAMVHQNLYQIGRLEEARLDVILEQLINGVVSLRDSQLSQVSVSLELEPMHIDADRAVPAAMLTTEAVINAYKHAWRESEPGWLRVVLKNGEDGAFELSVANSLGAPAAEEPETANGRGGLGRRLIEGFARQLRAELVIEERANAYEVRISVPAPPPNLKPFDRDDQ